MELKDRFTQWLEEAQAECDRVTETREKLLAERDARIAALRREYADRLSALDEELSTVRRMERALNPSAPAAPKPKAKTEGRGPQVSAELQLAVLRAVHGGAGTARDIVDSGIQCSKVTVHAALKNLRNDGLVRLAGQVPRQGTAPGTSGVGSKLYKITPDGEAYLEEHAPRPELSVVSA